MLQFRPPAGTTTGNKFYGPHRDVAYIGVGLIQRALHLLEPEAREGWFKVFAEACDEGQLASGTEALAALMNDAARGTPLATALDGSKLESLDPHAKAAIYTRIGQVAVSLIYEGLQEVHTRGDEAPLTIQQTIDSMEHLRV